MTKLPCVDFNQYDVKYRELLRRFGRNLYVYGNTMHGAGISLHDHSATLFVKVVDSPGVKHYNKYRLANHIEAMHTVWHQQRNKEWHNCYFGYLLQLSTAHDLIQRFFRGLRLHYALHRAHRYSSCERKLEHLAAFAESAYRKHCNTGIN